MAFKLQEVVSVIADGLRPSFRTVRVSSMQNSAHFLAELKAVNPDKLPGVLVVFDDIDFNGETVCAETRLSLILIDRFHADSEDRANKLFAAADNLMACFPLLGRKFGEAFVTPEDVQSASIDPLFSAIVLGIRIQQRVRTFD